MQHHPAAAASEKSALVLEIGAKYVKCGLAEERAPRVVLSWKVRAILVLSLALKLPSLSYSNTRAGGGAPARTALDGAMARVPGSAAARRVLRVRLRLSS